MVQHWQSAAKNETNSSARKYAGFVSDLRAPVAALHLQIMQKSLPLCLRGLPNNFLETSVICRLHFFLSMAVKMHFVHPRISAWSM
jgi:hypothetical protein